MKIELETETTYEVTVHETVVKTYFLRGKTKRKALDKLYGHKYDNPVREKTISSDIYETIEINSEPYEEVYEG